MNRNILITGVSQGLGKALTEKFISLGNQVMGCSRSSDKIQQLQKQYSQHNFQVVDVADNSQVQQWIESLPLTPDLVINNAAIINYPNSLWEVPADEFSQLIDINIKGTANIIRYVVPKMLTVSEGIIVNYSSGWGRSTSPDVAPYCASKWAIEGLTQALSQELPPNLATIALNPGIIHTEMLDICFGEEAKYYESVDEWVAKAAPFLLKLSKRNSGQSLSV